MTRRISILTLTFVALRASALFAQDITGTWQGTIHTTRDFREVQNGTTLTLNLVRATAQTAWEIPDTSVPEKPMAADANPSFEVATIKPSPPGTQGGGLGPSPGGRFTSHNTTLGGLLRFAYGLNRNQIENEPAWFETDRFDIVAKADMAGAPNMAQQRMMLQKLIAGRLNLRFHREQKEGTVFALTVQSSGSSKLTPSTSDPNGPSPAEMAQRPGHSHLTVTNVNIETFASGLQGIADRPVIDRTGLSGRFDITLDWTPDDFQSPGLGVTAPTPDTGTAFPDLYTALRNQLGLKLESTKGLVEIFVIDHIERPSEN